MLQRRHVLTGLSGIALAAGLFIFSPSMGSATSAAPKVGQPAPDFQAVDIFGKPVKLSDLRGKTVVLEWHNHDCPFVGKHYKSGNMQGLQTAATGEGVVWLTIVSSAKGEEGYVTPDEAKKLRTEQKAASSHHILDPEGKIGRLYDAKVTPHMYVIDATGKLVYLGGIDDKPSTKIDDVKIARPYVKEALEAIKTGKSPDPASTRAYGCTVKYSS